MRLHWNLNERPMKRQKKYHHKSSCRPQNRRIVNSNNKRTKTKQSALNRQCSIITATLCRKNNADQTHITLIYGSHIFFFFIFCSFRLFVCLIVSGMWNRSIGGIECICVTSFVKIKTINA